MADGATYDPSLVNLIVAGYPISGFTDGEFINVSGDVPSFAKRVGVDGEGAWAKSANRGGTLTLTLLASSDSNDVLAALLRLDLDTPGGAMFPLLMQDDSCRDLVSAARARIIELPPIVKSNVVTDKVWAIGSTRMLRFPGGAAATPLIGQVNPSNIAPF